MERSDAPAQALADGVLLVIVLALAIAAAVAPQLVILVGLPTIVAHRAWTAHRTRRS